MIKVLLVDDHLIVRNGVRLMLSVAADIEIAAEAESAREALSVADKVAFAVAIVDIGLPDRSGLDLVKLLKAKKAGLAVLVLSMYSEDVYAIRALKAGASGYLTKNCAAATLIGAVRKAAAGGRHISESLAEKFVDMAGGDPGSSHASLSDRELDVLKLISTGTPLVKIAETLHLSPHTVTTYRRRIMEKTGLGSNVDIARYALEHGLLLP